MKNCVFLLFAMFCFDALLSQNPGSLDLSFAQTGMVTTSLSAGADKAFGVAIQSDGKIIAAGYSTGTLTGKDFALVRYNSDGTLDTDFGVGGKVTTDLQSGSDDIAYDVIVQSDGKIVLAGNSDDGANPNGALIRYNDNGSIDVDFGVNGIVITDFISNQADEIHTLKYNAVNGTLIVGGTSVVSANVANAIIARYLSTGALDTNFNGTGILPVIVEVNDQFRSMMVEDLVVTTNGKISAIGWKKTTSTSINYEYWACRVSSNGSMDITFSGDGAVTYDETGSAYGYGLTLDVDGNYYISGTRSFNGSLYCRLLKVNADGTISNPSILYSNAGDEEVAYAIEMDNNGKLVMACTSTSGNFSNMYALRVDAAGGLDNAFNGTGSSIFNFPVGTVEECRDMLIQPDHKIVMVGSVDSDFGILRLLGDVAPQLTAFDLQTPIDNAVNVDFSSVNFNWTDAFGATGYELDLDVNSDFSTAQTFAAIASTTSLSGLLPGTTYYWRVRATDGFVWQTNGEVFSFTTNTLENFILISPLNNSVNMPANSLNVDWSDAIGATDYDLDWCTSSLFDFGVQTMNTTVSGATIGGLIPSTTYFWRVRANAGAIAGQYSEVWNFATLSLENFVLQLPLNNAANVAFNQVVLNWSSLSGATTYEVQTDISADFTTASTTNSATSDFTLVQLIPGTTYYWRVRAGDGINWGAYTESWSFTTSSLNGLLLNLPINGSFNQSITSTVLSVTGVSNASEYEFQLDLLSDFSSSGNTYSSLTTNFQTSTLLNDTVYYWRARAGYNGTWGDWTGTWSFTTVVAISVERIVSNANFQCYPNPFLDIVYLRIPEFMIGLMYRVTDAEGRLVRSGKLNRIQNEINTDDLMPGFYFINLDNTQDNRIKLLKY